MISPINSSIYYPPRYVGPRELREEEKQKESGGWRFRNSSKDPPPTGRPGVVVNHEIFSSAAERVERINEIITIPWKKAIKETEESFQLQGDQWKSPLLFCE